MTNVLHYSCQCLEAILGNLIAESGTLKHRQQGKATEHYFPTKCSEHLVEGIISGVNITKNTSESTMLNELISKEE